MTELAPLLPKDEYNQKLQANVHPADWVNPTPDGRYNLAVIGAGTAGLVIAAGAAALGAKVALIERHLMGGDCLNVGCVPSKGLISAARVARTIRYASEFGIRVPEGVHIDFAAIMQRMRRIRAEISPNDSAARFRDLGVDVYLGEGRFTGSQTIEVSGQQLQFKKAVIATGTRAAIPPIPGLDEVDYLTNETVFSLTKLPRRLGIIGAGPIGCELAQTFAHFGSEVFLIEAMDRILPIEDPEASQVVQQSLERDGIKLLCCGKNLQLRKEADGIRFSVHAEDRQYEHTVNQLLVAVGRAPNVENLGLETAGVEFDRTGVKVNDRLQTSNPHVYAAGDVCSKYKFTHAADFMARIVIRNSLFLGRAKVSALVIPWCTYTSPELAHVGIYPHEAERKGLALDTIVQHFKHIDRALLEGEAEGFVKIHLKKGTDRILGATIVAANAGDMISQLSTAMTNGIGLKKIANTIFPYPTQAEAIRKCGDAYNRTRLTPLVQKLLEKWLAWTR